MPSALLVNLQQRLSLGQIDSTLYGLPYLMDVLHMAYYAQDEELLAGWSYATFCNASNNFSSLLGA
jgi:hypothetical protein